MGRGVAINDHKTKPLAHTPRYSCFPEHTLLLHLALACPPPNTLYGHFQSAGDRNESNPLGAAAACPSDLSYALYVVCRPLNLPCHIAEVDETAATTNCAAPFVFLRLSECASETSKSRPFLEVNYRTPRREHRDRLAQTWVEIDVLRLSVRTVLPCQADPLIIWRFNFDGEKHPGWYMVPVCHLTTAEARRRRKIL